MFCREKNTLHGKKNSFRIRSLEALCVCIKTALVELKSQAFEGFRCKTKDGTQLVVHSTIASYAADIPETEDLLGDRLGIKTALP